MNRALDANILPRDLGNINDLKHIPLNLLHAELARRQQDVPPKPSCGTSGNKGSYNTPLHVAALVIILVLSTVACSFPIVARRFPRLPIPHHFLFLSRHFGTGVLIATAFVHLLPTAFVSLTDPCLPHFWNQGYPAMPGLIAMCSVFVVVTIEMFFATRGAGHMHSSEWDGAPGQSDRRLSLRGGEASHSAEGHHSHGPGHRQSRGSTGRENGQMALHQLRGSAEILVNGKAKPRDHDVEDSNGDQDSDLDAISLVADEAALLHDNDRLALRDDADDDEMTSSKHVEQNPQKLLLQCLLLEAGILFHSIFIGMALSVATGTSFLVLLVAISFHQTFEGLALGSRISALIPVLFDPSSPKPWLMALAYGTTTPIGQAIGLWMHELYDPASTMGLLMVGITNAISSGLLLFAGLVELLAEDFLSDRSYEVLKGRRRIEACISVACGGALMAIVGAFA